MLSLRFFDGAIVSVTEFLAFFSTPEDIRLAKTANDAVQMNQEMLELTLTAPNNILNKSLTLEVYMSLTSEQAGEEGTDLSVTRRTSFSTSVWDLDSPAKRPRTKKLDFAVTKLVILWVHVRENLSNGFFKVRTAESNTLSSNQFKVWALLPSIDPCDP